MDSPYLSLYHPEFHLLPQSSRVSDGESFHCGRSFSSPASHLLFPALHPEFYLMVLNWDLRLRKLITEIEFLETFKRSSKVLIKEDLIYEEDNPEYSFFNERIDKLVKSMKDAILKYEWDFQLIHTKATQTSTSKQFYLSTVYGMNHKSQRQHLWNDLITVSHNLASAWCIIGDFNTILAKEDRIEGNEVQESDVRELNSLIDECTLHELKSLGPYFSQTNKSIYSWIDHAFINACWHEVFDYTHSIYMSNGLSDHTPIVLQFLSSPKPQSSFQYCDMWGSHPAFSSIIASFPPPASPPLRCTPYVNIWTGDPTRIKQEREAQEKHISILSSSIALIKQQSKLEWIKYGDDCTRLFFAKAKQRKLSTYIYTLKTGAETQIEGFEKIGEIMFQFYKDLLGSPPTTRQCIDMSVIAHGLVLNREQQLHLCEAFSDAEIKEALFSIPNYKSPEPDGYSSGFF
ncbi:hypothetical protein Cgig2_015563 [Carnegiea gigantea]|uniref:Endonuclease/exonuclease/phosphatase domain-containing protein n=1 Tax=Carnegiea gigantea TaxID=171969 RepID=A0A9Q1QAI3_9CARY|nr:hypothetical protein Cgig2_015563 [Carnegiea gigantea]